MKRANLLKGENQLANKAGECEEPCLNKKTAPETSWEGIILCLFYPEFYFLLMAIRH